MARFYGWSQEEILRLTMEEFCEYYQAINILEAQEDKRLLDLISYPHISKKSDRDKFVKVLSKKARFNNEGVGSKSIEDFAKQLSRMANGG